MILSHGTVIIIIQRNLLIRDFLLRKIEVISSKKT
jgi:hypothetical protein